MAFVGITVNTVEVSKAFFFDRGVAERELGKGEAKALSKMGAYIRTTAKSSLRYATKKSTKSAPGQPPKVHRGQKFTSTNRKTGASTTRLASPLKELIFFTYDRNTKSVVVGPARFKKASSTPVPGILEHGGTVTRTIKTPLKSPTTGKPAKPRQAEEYRKKVLAGEIVPKKQVYETKQETFSIAKRPFVAPALTKNLSKFAGAFMNLDMGTLKG